MNTELIESLKEEIEELKEDVESLENGENEDEYKEMLDECYPVFKMGNLSFYPSDILASCDEIAFNIGLNEYNDEKISDLKAEIEDKEEEIKSLEIEDFEESENAKKLIEL